MSNDVNIILEKIKETPVIRSGKHSKGIYSIY